MVGSIEREDLKFLMPLITWYKLGVASQLPVQVANALDSLITLMGEEATTEVTT